MSSIGHIHDFLALPHMERVRVTYTSKDGFYTDGQDVAAIRTAEVIQRVKDDHRDTWSDQSIKFVRGDSQSDYGFLSRVSGLLYMLSKAHAQGARDRSKELGRLLNDR